MSCSMAHRRGDSQARASIMFRVDNGMSLRHCNRAAHFSFSRSRTLFPRCYEMHATFLEPRARGGHVTPPDRASIAAVGTGLD